MRVQLRETGSILVSAQKDRVLDVLRRVVQEGSFTAPDRLEGDGSTYVVRESPRGTQVFHMRSGASSVPAAGREREELRRAVRSDLFELRRVLDISER